MVAALAVLHVPDQAPLRCAGARQAAAIAGISVLATLLAVTLAWGAALLSRQRARRRAKYDLFPGMFGNGDLSWYPPDYRRAVIGAPSMRSLLQNLPAIAFRDDGSFSDVDAAPCCLHLVLGATLVWPVLPYIASSPVPGLPSGSSIVVDSAAPFVLLQRSMKAHSTWRRSRCPPPS